MMARMGRWWTFSVVLWLLVFSGCDALEPQIAGSGRGSLISSTQLSRLEKRDINAVLEGFSLGVFDVEAYRVVYETVDPDGSPTPASGLVLIPRNGFKEPPILVYSHGTITRDTDAPSQSDFDYRLMHLYATSGYLAVAPDLLGFGDSTLGFQPYVHAATVETASVDLMRAAQDLASAVGVRPGNDVFLTGYSQGGYSTMALHRALEDKYTDEFHVVASTPMAGPYDLSGVMADRMLEVRPHPNPFYLAILMISFNEIYGIGGSNEDMFEPAYRPAVEMFDRVRSGDEINRILPDVPREMLRADLIQDFVANPETHWLRLALKDNDLTDWTPEAPVRLYHCAGDRDIPVENTQVALAAFEERGANVTWVDPNPAADHGGCAAPSLFASKIWMDGFLPLTQ